MNNKNDKYNYIANNTNKLKVAMSQRSDSSSRKFMTYMYHQ